MCKPVKTSLKVEVVVDWCKRATFEITIHIHAASKHKDVYEL